MADEYRVSTLGAEALINAPADARVTAMGAEVLMLVEQKARISVLGVEVLFTAAAAPTGRPRNFMSFST